MNLYKKFKELNLDTSCLGLIPGSETSDYFCTPLGAKVIGWESVDGIHYCMVRGFKDMVFSVNPMDCCHPYVHPIASTFKDFLRLLLTCGNATKLEQIHHLDAEEFIQITLNDAKTLEQSSVLEEIQRHFQLSPLEHPYEYVKAIQEMFDYSSLRFSKEYYELIDDDSLAIPEFEVYFEGNFWGHGNEKKADKEIQINKVFSWGHETWHIPSIYSCRDGIVIDIYVQIDPCSIQDFTDKWQDIIQNDEISDELQEQMQSENPCLEDGTKNDSETEMLCEHYGCDKSFGWIFIRASFPWINKSKTQIHSLSICVKQDTTFIPGPHFTSNDKSIEFVHPLTEKKHSLTILSCTSEHLPANNFPEDGYEYPCHFHELTYRMDPELEQNSYMVRDCKRGDSPRPLVTNTDEFRADSYCGVAIIGSANGVGVISNSNKSHPSPKKHTTCSSLYFKAVENVEWRISLLGKTRDDIEIVLI